MSPTPTPTATTIEPRAAAVRMSLSQLARLSAVSARRIWESRLDDAELRRVEAVLDEVEREAEGDT